MHARSICQRVAHFQPRSNILSVQGAILGKVCVDTVHAKFFRRDAEDAVQVYCYRKLLDLYSCRRHYFGTCLSYVISFRQFEVT